MKGCKKANSSNKMLIESKIRDAIRVHLKGNLETSIKNYQSLIDSGIKDSRVYSNLGTLYQQSGDLNRAKSLYKKSINIFPNDPVSYANLANIYKINGSYLKAKKLLNKAIKIKPDFANAHANLAGLLKELNCLDSAKESILKAMTIQPKIAEYYFILAGIQNSLGQLREAIISLRKSIEIKPKYINSYSSLSALLRESGDLEEAKNIAQHALELDSKNISTLVNYGLILQDIGHLKEAELYTKKAIEINPKHSLARCNLGGILRDLGKLDEARKSIEKAIELEPELKIAYCNLAAILIDLGSLIEGEKILLKLIKLDKTIIKSYFILSLLNNSKVIFKFKDYLFSSEILLNRTKKDIIEIYFIRSYILHRERDFEKSASALKKANDEKLTLLKSDKTLHIEKSKKLYAVFKGTEKPKFNRSDSKQSIFIVGMPRSGSTLVESIISMNPNIVDLGESNIFEETFFEWQNLLKTNSEIELEELYLSKVSKYAKNNQITTNKYLYNYQYAGIIAKLIKNAKIVYCYRNPLDNILSNYRANFGRGSTYSSSIVDCTEVYLDHEEIMKEYKNKYQSKIYNLNYDLLVSDPNQEIRSIISWLGWEWRHIFLSPQLNQRTVSTASNIQVRSPINSKSLGGWKNYKEMLTPAITILKDKNHYL